MRSFGAPLALSVALVLSMFVPFIYADKGGFTPRGERVSESGQKAIIAWNGTLEILMLSTDVSSSKESEVVEIMPLPSNPIISGGEKRSFLKVQELVNTYLAVTTTPRYRPFYRLKGLDGQSAPNITITFQEMIGIHFLTVVRAEEADDLIQWLEHFLETRGYNENLPYDLYGLLQHYVQNGMSFFAIDMIKANSAIRTIDPLIYEFNTPKLYYPLRISTLFSGDTEISLFTLTSNELNSGSIIKGGFVKKAQFQIKHETLAKINPNMTRLFSSKPYLCYFRFSGSLSSFNSDILADFQTGLDTPTVTLATVSIGSTLALLLLFFPTGKIGRIRLRNVDLATTRRLEIACVLAGLVGVFLTCVGFFFPWGLVGFGESEEVLIALNGIYETSLPVTRSLLVSIPFDLCLIAAILCYAYLLLIERDSKKASGVLVAGGTGIMLQILLWISGLSPVPGTSYAYYPTYITNIGVGTTLIGCLFIIMAGMFSLSRITLAPKHDL